MQIRLTVVDPLGPPDRAHSRTASCDVLVTAPAGTALAAVASALASAVSGDGGASAGSGAVVLYAGAERLDTRRCTLGEPPLVDGAVLAVGAPAAPEPHPELDDAPTRLHVVAGPDAGGVHLLHGGQIHLGRSADADVPLDDPDVSRLHCAVTVAADGRVSVADLGSTNGTTLDGTRVGPRPVRFPPGALLRIGESALRLTPSGGAAARVPTAPDGEGQVRVSCGTPAEGSDPGAGHARVSAPDPRARERAQVPEQGAAPRIESHGTASGTGTAPGLVTQAGDTHAGRFGVGALDGEPSAIDDAGVTGLAEEDRGRKGTPLRGTDLPQGVRRRGGLTAWARRRLGGTRAEPGAAEHESYDAQGADGSPAGHAAHGPYDDGTAVDGTPAPSAAVPGQPDTWPDPAALLLTALGPGPRLWERGPGHPEALTVRLGTADRAAPDGSRLLPAVPVTADLREVGSLGLAGPRIRLAGLARAVVAQLAALHSPDALELVLISADRSRPVGERTSEWSWLGWLPHLRPGHGQDCRLLLAYDREQATARTDELLRRLEDHLAETRAGTGTGVRPEPVRAPVRRPSWARDDDPADEPDGFAGPFTVVVVDGDPGGADVREAVARLALEGPRAGIHVLCLAETAPASPASPVTETYEAACAAAPAFRECGAVALLSGDVATALRLLRVARDGGAGTGVTTSASGSVSWATSGSRATSVASGGSGSSEDRQTPGAGSDLSRDASAPGTDRRSSGDRHAPGAGSDLSPDTSAPSTDRRSSGDRHAPGAGSDLSPDASAPGTDRRSSRDRQAPATGSRPSRDRQAPATGSRPSRDASAPGADRRSSEDRQAPGAGSDLSWDAWAAGSGSRPSRDVSAAGVGGHPGDTSSATGRAAGAGAPGATGHDTTRAAGTAGTAPAGTPHARAAADPADPLGHPAPSTVHPSAHSTPSPSQPPHTGPVGHGTVAAVDAVSLAWAERFARALAPLRAEGGAGERHARVSAPLPQAARLLDELGLARATPASLMARWADAADDAGSLGGRAWAVLGAGPRGPVSADLAADGPHLLIEGPAGSGRTELLRAVVASLAAAERPDRLTMVLIDGRDSVGGGAGHGDGLRVCTDVPHVTTHLTANDPVRMREFAQSLSAELKRRAELLGRSDFAGWHTGREVSGRIVAQRRSGAAGGTGDPGAGLGGGAAGDLDTPPSSTLRLRPGAARRQTEAVPPLPRLVVVVDDLDALVSPPLGSPGRPAAGSVVRALEAVAREGARLGVHLVTATGKCARTAESEPARRAALRVTLDAVTSGPDEPAPGRGRLAWADGRVTAFQGGRVTGRIPRTATLRPTVVPLEWQRMGDPPTRRPVRELGNGPTDLALLASALERAAREVSASAVPSLL